MSAKHQNPAMLLQEAMAKVPRLRVGNFDIHFEFDELDAERDQLYLRKAEEELRETPELAREALDEFYRLIEGEEGLNVPLNDEYLKRFLRPCKWYPKSALKLMKRYLNYKREHPEFYGNLLPTDERAVFVSGVITPLPLRTSDGMRAVVLEGGKRWKPKEVTLNQIFRGCIITMEVTVNEPKTQIAGLHVIIDMEGLSLSQVTHFTPSFASSITEFLSRCLPCRLKAIHIVKQSFLFDMVFALFKPFLNAKLKERIIFHGNSKTSLLKYINAEALPRKYGGELDLPSEPIGEPYYDFARALDSYYLEIRKHSYTPS